MVPMDVTDSLVLSRVVEELISALEVVIRGVSVDVFWGYWKQKGEHEPLPLRWLFSEHPCGICAMSVCDYVSTLMLLWWWRRLGWF